MIDEKMISIIILTNGQEGRLGYCINNILSQDYSNKELIIVSSNPSDTLSNYEENSMIKIYIRPELSRSEARDFSLNKVNGEYIFFINPLDALMNDQVLSNICKDMEENNSNFLAMLSLKLKDGFFHYLEGEDDVEVITDSNSWFYFFKHHEMRTLDGKLFKKELLYNLNIHVTSEQQFVNYLIHNSTNPVFDKRGRGEYVWFEEEGRKPVEFNRDEIPLPDYLKDIELSTNERIDDVVNIAICADDNYCQHIAPMIFSIDKNTQEKVDIYLIYYKLNASSFEGIARLNEVLTNVKIKLRKVRDYQYEWLSQFKENTLPTEAYFRLLLPELVPEAKRIIYLDIDMLILSDIGKLYRIDLDNNILGVVRDYPFTENKDSWPYMLLGENGNKYFNSGMLLMDLELMRKNKVVERFTQFILETSKFYLLGDQDAFNTFFFYKVKLLEDKYNYVVENQKILENSNPETVIKHYCGYSDSKPWKIHPGISSYILPSIWLYRKYQRQANKVIFNRPKVLLIVHETEDLGKEVVTAESIDYQNYGNYEVALLPAKENSHADAIKAYYHQINIIKNKEELEQIAADADYLYFMKEASYFKDWDSLSNLVETAMEKNADYVMTSHQRFSVKDDAFYLPNESGDVVDISDRKLEDLIVEKPKLFSRNEGYLFSTEILKESNISLDMPDMIQSSRIFNGAKRKYLHDKSFWIEIDYEN